METLIYWLPVIALIGVCIIAILGTRARNYEVKFNYFIWLVAWGFIAVFLMTLSATLLIVKAILALS